MDYLDRVTFGGYAYFVPPAIQKPATSPGSDRKKIVSITTTLRDNDVLCGKDSNCHFHPGNKIFRQLVSRNVNLYVEAPSKRQKMKITQDIVQVMKTFYSARFLRKAGDQVWHEISDSLARDKVSHAIKFAAKHQQNHFQSSRATIPPKPLPVPSHRKSCAATSEVETLETGQLVRHQRQDVLGELIPPGDPQCFSDQYLQEFCRLWLS